MNILIAGGAGTFINNIIIKLYKEGHKVSILSGNRFAKKESYQRCFEVYNFTYDANCLKEIFESVAPDVTIFMGAYDSNFNWKNEEADAVKYTASLANVLMGYAMYGYGSFIYLSSDDVFGSSHKSVIKEYSDVSPNGFKAQAIYQGEQMCDNYHKNRDMDVFTVRFDNIYCIPKKRSDINDPVSLMCLEAIEEKTIHYRKEYEYSLLYENDAVEALYRIINSDKHNSYIYQISSMQPISEEKLANLVRDYINPECDILSTGGNENFKRVLSNRNFESEFGNPRFSDLEKQIKKIASVMNKDSYIFLTEEVTILPIRQRIRKKMGWFVSSIIPFLENLLIFGLCFFFYGKTIDSVYFARLDIYLLYVLLFAMVFGQQQATFSALLAVVGFFIRNTYDQSGFQLLLDPNTYVWIAQIFIVGLSVGYLRDQISKLKKENEEEQDFLKQQIDDIQVINSTNVRVKDVLETQVVNQTDSVGKIYNITSSLNQYSPEEVLFYAAKTVAKLMKCDDVAIYLVSNGDYARLFSATSEKARSLGNSIVYTKMGDLYESLVDKKVYINRKMDNRYPLMANAIYENDKMQMIIMCWGLSWENMTLGQANQLVITSSLIQNAVLSANRYIDALENERYESGTNMLSRDSFLALLKAFTKAEMDNLTECSVLRVVNEGGKSPVNLDLIDKSLRNSDYYGKLLDDAIYILLSNTSKEDASFVINRFKDKGLDVSIVEDNSVWLGM